MLSSGLQLIAHLPLALPPKSCCSLQDPGKAPKVEEATGAQPKLRKVALIVKLKKLMQEAEKGRSKNVPWAPFPVRGASTWLAGRPPSDALLPCL